MKAKCLSVNESVSVFLFSPTGPQPVGVVFRVVGGHQWSGCGLTSIQALIATLHDGAVNAGDEPRPRHHTEQEPHQAATDAHHHVVEEEEVGKAVKGLPVGGGGGV